MNGEKKGRPVSSDIQIIDLTTDDSNASEGLPQINDGITKKAFQKKKKGNSPVSQGFRTETHLSTLAQKVPRCDDQTIVGGDVDTSCLASVLNSEFKKQIWVFKTEAWRMSKGKVTNAINQSGDSCSHQAWVTGANDKTSGNIVRSICDATASLSIKECPENLHDGSSEEECSPISRLAQIITTFSGTTDQQKPRSETGKIAWKVEINHAAICVKVEMEIIDVEKMTGFRKLEIPSSLNVVSEIDATTAFSYFQKVREAINQEICIAKFTPATSVDLNDYLLFCKMHENKGFAVLKTVSNPIKDLYLTLLVKGSSIPLVLESPGMKMLEQNLTHSLLLGVVVLTKIKLDVDHVDGNTTVLPLKTLVDVSLQTETISSSTQTCSSSDNCSTTTQRKLTVEKPEINYIQQISSPQKKTKMKPKSFTEIPEKEKQPASEKELNLSAAIHRNLVHDAISCVPVAAEVCKSSLHSTTKPVTDGVKPDVSSSIGKPVNSAIPTTIESKLHASSSLTIEQTVPLAQETLTTSPSSLLRKRRVSRIPIPSINPLATTASSSSSKTDSTSSAKPSDLPSFTLNAVRKRVGAQYDDEKPTKIAKIDREVRRSISKTIFTEVLWNRCRETVDLKMDKAAIRRVALKVEESLYSRSVNVGAEYLSKYRTLLDNIKDPKNFLFRQILTEKIKPSELVEMSPEELPDADMSALRKLELRYSEDGILMSELTRMSSSKPDAIETCKEPNTVEKPDEKLYGQGKTVPIATVPSLPIESRRNTTAMNSLPRDGEKSYTALLKVDLKKNESKDFRNDPRTNTYCETKKDQYKASINYPSFENNDQYRKHSQPVKIIKKSDANNQTISSSAPEAIVQSVSDSWMLRKVNSLHVLNDVINSETAEPRQGGAIDALGKSSEKQFRMAKLDLPDSALLPKNKIQNQPSADAAFREAIIHSLGLSNDLVHRSLNSKVGTLVVGESSSYSRLGSINNNASSTFPTDPHLGARTLKFERTPATCTNIPLSNKDGNSSNIKEPSKKIWRSWD